MDTSANFASPATTRSDGIAVHGTDDGLHVQFFIKPKYMEALSKDASQPIYQDRIMTRIFAPGMTKTIWEHEARGITYETVIDDESGEYQTSWEVAELMENGEKPEPLRFPNAWNAFVKKGAKINNGWPIEEWGAINRSFGESLKALNIHTVEAMAGLSDQAAANVMGGIKYRDLAKSSLDERKKNEIVSREQSLRERSDERADALAKEVSALKAQINQLVKSNGKDTGGGIRKVHKDQIKQLAEVQAPQNFEAA